MVKLVNLRETSQVSENQESQTLNPANPGLTCVKSCGGGDSGGSRGPCHGTSPLSQLTIPRATLLGSKPGAQNWDSVRNLLGFGLEPSWKGQKGNRNNVGLWFPNSINFKNMQLFAFLISAF